MSKTIYLYFKKHGNDITNNMKLTINAVKQWQYNCNYGQDIISEAIDKIQRAICLGKVIEETQFISEGNNGNSKICHKKLYRYYCVNISIVDNIVVGIWKNKHMPLVEVSKDTYNSYNKKHGLKGRK